MASPWAAASGILRDTAYDIYGEPALWRTGGGGAGLPVTVIFAAPDEIDALGQSQVFSPNVTIKVRRSDVVSPAQGDTVEVDGLIYRLAGEPRLADGRRLEWTCIAREV